jgi:hypothetical protein
VGFIRLNDLLGSKEEMTETTAGNSAARLESLAFQFCKIATFALIAGRLALPLASGLACVLFASAYFKGKRDTRCWAKYPLAISAFWGVVCVVSTALLLDPSLRDRAFAGARFWR